MRPSSLWQCPAIPRALQLALLMLAGIWLTEWLHVPLAWLLATTALIVAAGYMLPLRWARTESFLLSMSVVLCGGVLWSRQEASHSAKELSNVLLEQPELADATVRMFGTIGSIPALDTAGGQRRPSAVSSDPRTLFLFDVHELVLPETRLAVKGRCRVLVDGDATSHIAWGDRVLLTGRLDVARPPMNPGEFDFATHLKRCGIAAMVFLKHPSALELQGRHHPWSARGLLNLFRQQTAQLLAEHLSPRNRATAEALLLGNRGHLTTDLERDFISSGTMHLLAISGLHVGILYVFLMRVFHLLLVPRNHALLIAGLICLLYAFLTDLRPSVLRASVFILFSVFGQLICREIRMGTLIGLTALVLLLFDPAIAFDVGAWLSFLAVGALGWVTERRPPEEDRVAPAEALTWQDQTKEAVKTTTAWLLKSLHQMLAVTLLSAPLVASQFHLVSLSGMVVNILLIPFSSLTLISGYIFVATGLLFPPVAAVAGSVFEFLLASLNYAVSWTADVRFGFLMIPDLPAWFLPVYYVLLILSAAAARSVVRQCLRIVLMTLVVVQLWIVCQTPTVPELRCTILSVGHGNAVVVETGRRVIVVDAGAMNRGESAADIISRCLWNRGHRMIDALVLSHPDADHYNAAPELLERMPVGRICISREFAASQAQEVQDLLARIESLQVPLSVVTHMDCLSDPATSDEAWSLRFMQHVADSSRDTADNEASLVVLLETPNATLCLPGDLEGDGQNGLIPLLEPCDLLVAPHHGSPAANTTELARKLKSPIVVLSAGDDRYLAHNQRIYRDRQILLTARDGAVTASFPAPEQMLIQTWANGLPSHWSRVSK